MAGPRRFVFRSNDLTALRNAVRAGLGLTVLPHFLAAGDAGLAFLPEPACPVVREMWLVVHPDVKRSPRVRLVADLIVELVDGARALLLTGNG